MRCPRAWCAAVAVAVLLALAAAAFSGCAPKSATVAANGPVTAMSLKERTLLLPQGFPPQVPVPTGTVSDVSGAESANGNGVWAYTADVASSPQTLADWYTQTLTVLNWDAISATSSGSPIEREYRKGDGAQIRVSITPAADSGARAVVSVSLGMPVTPAQ